MIQILDEITLAPERIPDVLALLRDQYLPSHAARGLTLLGRWVSPPVAIPGQPNVLWLSWQVPDAPAYYRMRATADAGVFGFWAAVDAICESRRRHVMTDADVPLPSPLSAPEVDHAA
ncbi:hypothetical protein [Burkholderia guangdongensis]|uniref:hypothetical protein n=1 Tax=Burkholderia guangdongensis TaxID=1792500 RepID=UPI0015C70DAC|nr:hypothetical protein [Burkholderia guangdongensis]